MNRRGVLAFAAALMVAVFAVSRPVAAQAGEV
jgi:hypothetical protein